MTDVRRDRGDVLGAVHTLCQGRMFEEKFLKYKQKKHARSLPIFKSDILPPHERADEVVTPVQLVRSMPEEKTQQGVSVKARRDARNPLAPESEYETAVFGVHEGHGLANLQRTARERRLFVDFPLEAAKMHWPQPISYAMYGVGSQYRRST